MPDSDDDICQEALGQWEQSGGRDPKTKSWIVMTVIENILRVLEDQQAKQHHSLATEQSS